MTGSAGRSVQQKTAAAKRGWRTRMRMRVSRETVIGRAEASASEALMGVSSLNQTGLPPQVAPRATAALLDPGGRPSLEGG